MISNKTSVKDAISVIGLSKTFMIPHERKFTLFEALMFIGKMKYEKLYAVKDATFNIKKGEFIGIVGSNGSGKSTLLKTIAGILVESGGNITVDGRMTTFLELGAGFHTELTAKENLFLYGAIMGMDRREILSKYKKIVRFAGLEKFMDTKLKGFSSGMKARLAFSIATHSEFDILVVDEVLAVGDIEFQRKCYSVFKQLEKSGKTIILVSHDMNVVKKFCKRVIWMDKGKIVMDDVTKKVISKYILGKAH